MNKHQLVSEREYEECLDHVYTLNEDTPVIKTYERENVAIDPDLVFGLDTRLFEELKDKYMIDGYVDGHHTMEVDLIQLESGPDESFSREKLEEILKTCSKDEIYRIKGFIKIEGEGMCILNFAFERWEIIPLTRSIDKGDKGLRLTVMLARGEGRQWEKEFAKKFAGQNVHIHYHPA
jgi:G3E family GTPase